MSRFDLNDLSCQLGNKTVPATVINLAEIRCVAPAVNGSGAVALSVLRYGEEITTQKLKFFYRNDAAVLSVTPNHATERRWRGCYHHFSRNATGITRCKVSLRRYRGRSVQNYTYVNQM